MSVEDEDPLKGNSEEDGSEESSGFVSRTRRREEAKEVTRLALELIALPPAALEQLGLPLEIQEAIVLCRGLKLRARARQKRLIAQMLRSEDCDAIRRRVANQGAPQWADVERAQQNEQWCDRLVSEGDSGLQAFMEVHPDSDRGQLRRLVRAARVDASEEKADRARQKLLRLIASLREG